MNDDYMWTKPGAIGFLIGWEDDAKFYQPYVLISFGYSRFSFGFFSE